MDDSYSTWPTTIVNNKLRPPALSFASTSQQAPGFPEGPGGNRHQTFRGKSGAIDQLRGDGMQGPDGITQCLLTRVRKRIRFKQKTNFYASNMHIAHASQAREAINLIAKLSDILSAVIASPTHLDIHQSNCRPLLFAAPERLPAERLRFNCASGACPAVRRQRWLLPAWQ